MMAVHIDLNELTEERLQAALAAGRAATSNQRRCLYSAPCIIGTLIPEGAIDETRDEDFIHRLLGDGTVTCPADQRDAVIGLQEHYDQLDIDDVHDVEEFNNKVRGWFKK
jgi:hypothetical protein